MALTKDNSLLGNDQMLNVYQIQEPLDVVSQMLFLGSADASFMNGEVVIVDGGHSVTSAGFERYVLQAEEADRIQASKD